MNELLEILRGIDLLKGISEEDLLQIASIAEEIDFAEGDIIFREHSPAENLYLVTEGNVSLEICAPSVGCRRILTVGKGELLGWSPVLENARYTATARAMALTRTVRMNGRQLLTLCEYDSSLGYHFMQRAALALSKRLSATRLQLLNVFGTEMPTVPVGGETANQESR
jgi:CRP/FNR family transcriptional regulator, cyclic AMP receptor protein